MIQASTRSAQLGLGSVLVDWYLDAVSVPYGHLFINLSPRTDDRLRYCTNTRSFPSKFYVPHRLKQSKFLDNEQTKYLYSPGVPTIQKSFPSVLPKRVYQVLVRMYSKSTPSKPAEHKKTANDKTSERSLIALSENNHLETKKRRSGIQKTVTTSKNNLPSRHEQFVLIWSSFFSSLILCTTTKTRV